MICTRFNRWPWVLPSHSHPHGIDSSTGLRKNSLLKRETHCSISKEGKDWSSIPPLCISTSAARHSNTYLLGQRHGPSAGCACLLVPPGGQSPCCGMRLCPEKNESPGEAEAATWKQHPHESQIQCHPLPHPHICNTNFTLDKIPPLLPDCSRLTVRSSV